MNEKWDREKMENFAAKYIKPKPEQVKRFQENGYSIQEAVAEIKAENMRQLLEFHNDIVDIDIAAKHILLNIIDDLYGKSRA